MLEYYLSMIVFLFPLAYSPGPGNIFFASCGASVGFRNSLAALAGYHLATFIVTLLIGYGLVQIQNVSVGVTNAIRWIGIAYIIWLALCLYRAAALDHPTRRAIPGFTSGVLLLVLNPKAYVIIGALFSQFLNSEGDPKRAVLVISALFTVNNLIAFIIWTVAGDWLSRLFSHPDKARLLNRGLSVMLLAVAIWLALGV